MATTTKQTKLTFKQIVLTMLLSLVYFLLGPFMPQHDPRRKQIEDLLNEGDMISGDYANIIQRRAAWLDREDALKVIAYIEAVTGFNKD